MNRILLPFITYIAFVAESTIMQVLAPEHYNWGFQLIPHFSLVLIILISCYLKPSYGIVYGMVFGLLTDLIYTDLIGVYMFSTALVAYFISVLSRYLFSNFFVAILLSAAGAAGLEFMVYGLNSLIGIADTNIDSFFYDRLLPTLILNAVFTILVYYPFAKLLKKVRKAIHEN
ncbi:MULTISPECIES: rod shape-determining protein MreD [Fictibacillus]|uniref:Rod shape-determining protein MreD n=1 Tax=Fictibacillus terranigra TaxID=3058424 RepID=A0ABT8E498_9BACL|nr:rod shape-determining protein MreD [Fictibacillus sp. CENA-BCM004]MDN4072731.1 rod shape-determining protein MreD [Fictibacillus sp. CENA-BCM004]